MAVDNIFSAHGFVNSTAAAAIAAVSGGCDMELTCCGKGPVFPTLVVCKGKRVVAQLVPDAPKKRYKIDIISDATDAQMKAAEKDSEMKRFAE
jgi:hypothetical protein